MHTPMTEINQNLIKTITISQMNNVDIQLWPWNIGAVFTESSSLNVFLRSFIYMF